MKSAERRRCGLCGNILRPGDSISVVNVGHRCYRCFNNESADRLGIDFDNTPIEPIVVNDLDGAPHRFEIRSMLVPTGHAMYAREVSAGDPATGYRFAILGDVEADAISLSTLLRERIREGLSVRHVEQTPHGWQLTQADRLKGVIEWDPATDGALPLLIIDGRAFTWGQVGRMLMTFEGFTLNAVVQDSIEVVGGPLADDRLEHHASREPPRALPTLVRTATSKRKAPERRKPTRAWPPSRRRLDELIEEATVDAYGESEQATAFLTMLEQHLALPFDATVLGQAVVVEKIDLSNADELIAICRRGVKRQRVRLLDLELPVSPPKGAEWIAAYRRWSRGR